MTNSNNKLFASISTPPSISVDNHLNFSLDDFLDAITDLDLTTLERNHNSISQDYLKALDDDGNPPIHIAYQGLLDDETSDTTTKDHCYCVIRFLLERRADCNAVNSQGISLLHLVTAANKIDFVKLLLSYDIDVKQITESLASSLVNIRIKIAELLLAELKERLSPEVDNPKICIDYLLNLQPDFLEELDVNLLANLSKAAKEEEEGAENLIEFLKYCAKETADIKFIREYHYETTYKTVIPNQKDDNPNNDTLTSPSPKRMKTL